MSILVDSSAWVDYLRGGPHSVSFDALIDENLIATNELILSELLPALISQGKKEIADLLRLLPLQPLSIDWNEIRAFQLNCIKKGFTGIGIPDLIVAQNAIQNNSALYTFDKHFRWLAEVTPLKLFSL